MASVACTSGTIPLVSTIPIASLMIPLFRLAQNAVEHAIVGARNDVDRDQLADAAAGSPPCIPSRPPTAHIAADYGRDEAAADLDNLHQFHRSGLAHGVAGIDQPDE